jgi:hypothetical protein
MKEEAWFSKSVFYAMALLTMASTITACSTLVNKPSIPEIGTDEFDRVLLNCIVYGEGLYSCEEVDVRDK